MFANILTLTPLTKQAFQCANLAIIVAIIVYQEDLRTAQVALKHLQIKENLMQIQMNVPVIQELMMIIKIYFANPVIFYVKRVLTLIFIHAHLAI